MDDGTFLRHDPPDEIHGNIVRNLTQAIGPCLKQEAKYIPCFELPLLLNAEKPTIRIPAISFFPASKGFGMMDELVTAQAPTLAVEIASSRWRREAMSSRVKDYLLWGVQAVWVVDPVSRHVHQFGTGTPPKMIKETETMHGYPYFADLHVLVIDLFADPNWLHPAKPPVREG
jgi:Uma2 family endonuclease